MPSFSRPCWRMASSRGGTMGYTGCPQVVPRGRHGHGACATRRWSMRERSARFRARPGDNDGARMVDCGGEELDRCSIAPRTVIFRSASSAGCMVAGPRSLDSGHCELASLYCVAVPAALLSLTMGGVLDLPLAKVTVFGGRPPPPASSSPDREGMFCRGGAPGRPNFFVLRVRP
eukprot:COSAG06_NODE_3466_length_5299_cov_160.374808_7_plen_175_part_00